MRRALTSLSVLLIGLGPLLLAPRPAAAEATAAKSPVLPRVALVSGSLGGNPATLAVRDHFGPPAPAGHLRLDPAGGRFIAQFTFPAGAAAGRDLLLALRAPEAADGSWQVQVRRSGGWVSAGRWPLGKWWGGSLPLPASRLDPLVVRIVGTGSPLLLDRLALAPTPWRPTPGTSWQIQFSGALDTSRDVAMYDLDLFDTPDAVFDQLHADGRRVMCYFSAGSWEDWRPDAGDFPAAVLGDNLAGWPGERWLDVSRLDLLGPIMEARLDLAVARGCDGVDPDNVDGYANDTGFDLTAAQQRRYNTFLAERAHERGLSVGLKNDLNQVRALVPLFDWALNEQCFHFNECSLLLPFVDRGKAVFGIEYQGDPASFCPRANAWGFSWLLKERRLGPEFAPC